jgi:trehalose utilization protein
MTDPMCIRLRQNGQTTTLVNKNDYDRINARLQQADNLLKDVLVWFGHEAHQTHQDRGDKSDLLRKLGEYFGGDT